MRVKSFSVGDGDMFYIKHGSDNFTVIDCCLYHEEGIADAILDEIDEQSSDKTIKRFISTHPDDDHIDGLTDFDNRFGIVNFYCVDNAATKTKDSDDFDRYCELRDGDVQSQVNAANAFYLGQGTKEDHVKAHQWWLKAAQRGHLQSQKNVGANYWNGDGVEKDDSWAAFWYEMAGQQGDPQAQFSTGWFYMTGTGVQQDKRKGLKWIHRATAQGFEHAKQWCRDNGYSIY